jgi:hypothetical protein
MCAHEHAVLDARSLRDRVSSAKFASPPRGCSGEHGLLSPASRESAHDSASAELSA